MSQTDEISNQKSMCVSMCMHVCACVCMCVRVAFKLITATWKQINSAVNSTPQKTLCMYHWVHVCARPRERGSVWARHWESVCWFDWFSQSHLKLWMSWSPVAISSLQPQSPLLPNTTEHNAIHLPLSTSPPFHARLQHPLTHKYAHSFFPSFPVFLSYTHLCPCFLPLLSSSLSHTHIHISAKSKPPTHTYVVLVVVHWSHSRKFLHLWRITPYRIVYENMSLLICCKSTQKLLRTKTCAITPLATIPLSSHSAFNLLSNHSTSPCFPPFIDLPPVTPL